MTVEAAIAAWSAGHSLTRHRLIGVSGGRDSMVLLHALHRAGARLTICHVDHRLRGAAVLVCLCILLEPAAAVQNVFVLSSNGHLLPANVEPAPTEASVPKHRASRRRRARWPCRPVRSC